MLGSFTVGAGETGVDANVAAAIPSEGFVLSHIGFSGAGTYLTGLDGTSNKSLFINNVGISNSGTLAQYYMFANVTATPVAVQNTFVKVLGTTTPGPFVTRFTLSDNRALYTGVRGGYFKVTATLSLTSGNNQVISVRAAVNGVTDVSSESTTTTSAAGRSENLKLQGIVQLTNPGVDFVEIWVTNETAATAITVSDLNVIVERVSA